MWAGEWDVRHFPELDSTNTQLCAEARQGAPEGLVLVADHQTAGRGRLDRRWEAPPGSALLLSVLLRPELDPADLHLCTAALALAARAACQSAAGVVPAVKWPNDLLVDERKLAGILAETDVAAGAVRWVVAGIGLNLSWPGPERVGGTCLDDHTPGDPVGRDAVLEALLSALAPRRSQLESAEGRAELAADFRAACSTIGHRVRVERSGDTVSGEAVDVDAAGHLVVQTDDGRRTVTAGDVVHVHPA